jgi:methionyl-tRNA synthetase
MNLVRDTNRIIEENAPWNLAKEKDTDSLNTLLYYLAERLASIAILVYPFLPNTAEAIIRQLGLEVSVASSVGKNLKTLLVDKKVRKGKPLFPKK